MLGYLIVAALPPSWRLGAFEMSGVGVLAMVERGDRVVR